ncbi:hypothetical protein [Variovorax paradoxus]|uniref:hypothetical protein n=1 Tax=Variovorax paradoxus TaxID=34073 RepID=UPI003D649F38
MTGLLMLSTAAFRGHPLRFSVAVRALAGLLAVASTSLAAAATPQGKPAALATAEVHVIVALVDNASQGIVPVPASIGNGDDPASNLYWGAAYGLKTFLSRAPHWRRLNCQLNVSDSILERCVFSYKGDTLRLTAEAWRGKHIDRAMLAFMQQAATPPRKSTVREMIAFVGHNGLMDLKHQSMPDRFARHGTHAKMAVILACQSDAYFRSHLLAAGAHPVVTTFSLMAPEGYVMEAIAREFAQPSADLEQVMRRSAGDAYAKFQKISARAGRRVFGAR